MALLDLKLWNITRCLNCSYLLPGISKSVSLFFFPQCLSDIARSREAKNAKESESESCRPCWHRSALLSLNWKWISLFLFCCILLCLVIASHRRGNGHILWPAPLPSTWVNQLSNIPTQGLFKPFSPNLIFRHIQMEECLEETRSVVILSVETLTKFKALSSPEKKKKINVTII